MTVSAEAAAPGVDRAVVEQQFTEVYAEHYTRLRWHIHFRLPLSHVHVAEDLAQETFMSIWQDMERGKLEVKASVYGLLCFVSHNRIASYFRRMTSTQRPIDFGDPTNTYVTSGHRYASSEPGLASVSAELDEAMERMQEASKVWRELHGLIYRDRGALAHGVAGRTLTPDIRQLKEERLAASEQAEPEALTRFQDACLRVAQLRAELEAAAPYWNSSTGLAPAVVGVEETGKQRSGIRSDLSLTHCHNGHRLTRDNIHFMEDGARTCRPCKLEVGRKHAGHAGSAGGRYDTPADVLEAARSILMDPERDDLTLKQVVKLTGLSEATVIRRLPDAVAARRSRRGKNRSYRRTDPSVWEAARAMLLDLDSNLTVEQIAKAVGVGFTTLHRQMPEVLAERAEARKALADAPFQTARAMLLDPANTMSLREIAASVGTSEASLYRRLPDALALRRDRMTAPALVSA